VLEPREQVETLLVHRVEPTGKHGLEQLLLGPEVVVGGGQIDARGRRDRAKAGRLETVLHEQGFRRVEDLVLGHRRPARMRKRDHTADHWHHSIVLVPRSA
jgi:hypothetical protein